MRIAQIAPLCESVPPALYGGTERVVAHLCDSLVEMGHDITLFASADSKTLAHLKPCRDLSIRLDPHPLKSQLAAHMKMLAEVRQHADDFDMLHFHLESIHFPFFEDRPQRTLTTMHGRLDIKDLEPLHRAWPQFPLVSISDRQREDLAFANWAGTVYHGLPPSDFPLPEQRVSGGYLAFLGRFSREKRPDRAIEIAKRCGRRLKIAAKIDPADTQYFHDEVEPLLNSDLVESIGEVGGNDKLAFLSQADALLFPIDWPEPFGLVLIEAMACGTPVIAWDCGSVPELIDDGETGFIVHSEEEAVEAIGKLHTLDPRHMREVFERRFSANVMAANYVKIYERLLANDSGSSSHSDPRYSSAPYSSTPVTPKKHSKNGASIYGVPGNGRSDIRHRLGTRFPPMEQVLEEIDDQGREST